jgi:hypothetical protein
MKDPLVAKRAKAFGEMTDALSEELARVMDAFRRGKRFVEETYELSPRGTKGDFDEDSMMEITDFFGRGFLDAVGNMEGASFSRESAISGYHGFSIFMTTPVYVVRILVDPTIGARIWHWKYCGDGHCCDPNDIYEDGFKGWSEEACAFCAAWCSIE